jgi:hypothetical protein
MLGDWKGDIMHQCTAVSTSGLGFPARTQTCGMSAHPARKKRVPALQLNRDRSRSPGGRGTPRTEALEMGFFCAAGAADIPQLGAAGEPEAESGHHPSRPRSPTCNYTRNGPVAMIYSVPDTTMLPLLRCTVKSRPGRMPRSPFLDGQISLP